MPKSLVKPLYYILILLIVLLSLVIFKCINGIKILKIISNIISPILIGYIIAWILNPIYKKLNNKLDKKLSFIIILSSLILIYIILFRIVIPIIINESINVITVIEDFIEKIKTKQNIVKFNNDTLVTSDNLFKHFNTMFSNILNVILGHMFGFYILFNYDNISSYVKKLLPIKYKSLILKFTRKISSNMYLYIKGTLIDTLILFIMVSILFSIMKLKYSLPLSLFLAITNVIPFIGPYIGGLPAVIVGISNNLKFGFFVLIIVVLIQTIESNVINPIIMSKCIKINPLLIVISITVMGNVFGIIGIIFAVPSLILIKITIEFISKYRKLILEIKKD